MSSVDNAVSERWNGDTEAKAADEPDQSVVHTPPVCLDSRRDPSQKPVVDHRATSVLAPLHSQERS